ncbi:MAG: hypothetical protein ACI4HJ_07365 [Ruminococcus sp.]
MKANLKKSIALILVMALLGCAALVNVSAISVDTENKYKYDEIIIPKVFQDYELENPDLVIYYNEVFEYYAHDTDSSQDESIPEYVLIYLSTNMSYDMPTADVFGEYILKSTSIGYPFAYGYGIYIPSTKEVYSLTYAYELGIEGIEQVFTEAKIGRLIGDMDKDREITIKDATIIQKCLAGISEFDKNDYIIAFSYEDNPPLLYVSDFNRDCNRNIEDATAIQKHLAKMDF